MSRVLTLSLCLLSLGLTACNPNQPPPPDGGGIPMSTTAKGAIFGGLAGGGLGSMGGSAGAAVVGAAAGAAIGAVIGNQIEKEQVVEIHQDDKGVRLVRQDKTVKLIMPSDIYFKSGDARIQSMYYPILDGLVMILKGNPDTFIEVIGYTDNEGDHADNQELGKTRATNVAAYLESQGIPASRIHAHSRGSATPQATNSTAAGRGENRRVEIKAWRYTARQ